MSIKGCTLKWDHMYVTCAQAHLARLKTWYSTKDNILTPHHINVERPSMKVVILVNTFQHVLEDINHSNHCHITGIYREIRMVKCMFRENELYSSKRNLLEYECDWKIDLVCILIFYFIMILWILTRMVLHFCII